MEHAIELLRGEKQGQLRVRVGIPGQKRGRSKVLQQRRGVPRPRQRKIGVARHHVQVSLVERGGQRDDTRLEGVGGLVELAGRGLEGGEQGFRQREMSQKINSHHQI
jgi:hypothetical protein